MQEISKIKIEVAPFVTRRVVGAAAPGNMLLSSLDALTCKLGDNHERGGRYGLIFATKRIDVAPP